MTHIKHYTFRILCTDEARQIMERLGAVAEKDQHELMEALCLKGADEQKAVNEALRKTAEKARDQAADLQQKLNQLTGECNAWKREAMARREEAKWKQFTSREPTENELKLNPALKFVLFGFVPEDGQLILVSDGKTVWVDKFYRETNKTNPRLESKPKTFKHFEQLFWKDGPSLPQTEED